MQQNKILDWLKQNLDFKYQSDCLKQSFEGYHSDMFKKRILKDIEKQRNNNQTEFGWVVPLLDENDFSNGFFGKIKYFSAKRFNNILIFTVNKNKKELKIANTRPRNKIVIGYKVEIILPLHSGIYLPEIPVPDTEYEKYKEMQQNLQQAIELETGLKFDTQAFLSQYKEKLGI